MSGHGVYGDDMDDVPDFEDPALDDLLARVRVTYRSQTPPASPPLADFFAAAPRLHRSNSMRRVLAQLVAATTVVVAATGGLAVAGALPAPVQHVVSSAADGVGVDVPQGDDATPPTDPVDDTSPTTAVDESTTTVDEPTTVADGTDESADDESADSADEGATHSDNHGAEVSAVARDKTLHGCEHGRAVSSVASGKVNTKPCPHTDDAADADDTDATTPPTTVATAPPAPEPTAVTGTRTPPPKKSTPVHGNSNGRGRGHGKHGG